MRKLVKRRPMPIDRLEEGLRRRDLHEVVQRVVERPCAANPEIDARRPDQRFCLREDKTGFDGRGRRYHIRR